jgi:hypothetical protein
MVRFRLIFLLLLTGILKLVAQPVELNHPELSWQTLETEHFFVHFHNGTARTAALVAKIGEEIYTPITTLYGYEPDTKIHFIIKDFEDYANGAAFYYDNKIEFWAPAVLDFPFRGTHSWLRNTITHEFSHMISLGAARKFPRTLQAVYFQWLGYEKEKRKDVIHGYPNVLVSVPYPGTIVPMWFAEGIAQYQRSGLDYEIWDTHRDMLLRTAVLAGHTHSLQDMGYFGKNSLGNERVYNQGYGFTRYLAARGGESAVRDLARTMGKKTRTSFSKTAEEVFGQPAEALYDEWMTWLKTEYAEQIRPIQEHRVEGRLIEDRGLANFYAVWSPDGQQIAYLSNRGRDYLSQRSLWIFDTRTGKSRKVRDGVGSSVSWSPDGTRLVYARHKTEKHGCRYFELFVYDLSKRKEKQITREKRARQPDWGPGGRIVCVIETDGLSDLAVLNADGSGFQQITAFDEGQSLHLPRWTADGRILFALNGLPDSSEHEHGRDIAVIGADGSGLSFILRSAFDERDPWPLPDGTFVYSTDEHGIFNLVRYFPETGERTRLTQVTGGAFLPSVNQAGQCVFSRFDEDGFKLALLDSLTPVSRPVTSYTSPYTTLNTPPDSRTWAIARYDDSAVPEYEARPYKPLYAKFIFLPRVLIDYPGKLKAGSYMYSSDFLDKFSFFGGAAVNSQFDTDLYGIFEYRRFAPTLFLELYQVRRKTSENDPYIRWDKINFDLLGVTGGLDYAPGETDRFRLSMDLSRYRSEVSGFVKYQNVPFKFATVYHKGAVAGLEWRHRAIPPTLLSHIAPRAGRNVQVRVDYAMQRFFDFIEQDSETGIPVEKYKPYDYFQTQLDWHEFLPSVFSAHSFALRLRGGVIDRRVDPFYNLYAGGLDGMKGYPFYSLEGRKLAHLGLAYRFPLKRNMNARLAMFHLRDAFLSLYGDIGDAWNRNHIEPKLWKRDAGIELRLSLFSYYAFPMKVAFDAAYGFDTFTIRDTLYGREWRYYVTVLFDFLDLTAGWRDRRTDVRKP